MSVNPDLQRERDRATFEPLELTYFLDEGKEHTDRRRYIENIVKTDPELRNAPNNVLLSQEENYTEGMRRVKIFSQRVKDLNITNPQDLNIYNRYNTIGVRISIIMFRNTKGVNPGGDGGYVPPPCFDMGGITCLLSPPCFDPQICCFFGLEN